MGHRPHVRDLVGELYMLRVARKVRRVFDLKTLALELRQPFIVRDFLDDTSYVDAESRIQFLNCGLGVFKRVVQDRGLEGRKVVHVTDADEQFGYFYRMVYIRRRFDVLATLVSMFIGSAVQRFE